MLTKTSPFLMLLCILYASAKAQTAEQVLEKMYDVMDDVNTLTYTINNIDTFSSGKVWNKTGYCMLTRDNTEPIFGYLFKAKRDDVDDEIIFYGRELHLINHKEKTYKVEKEIDQGMFGSPGGQMILREIVWKVAKQEKLSLSDTDTSFILKAWHPDIPDQKIVRRYQELHIDRLTYIPFYVYRSYLSNGNKSSSISRLSDVRLNASEVADLFRSKDHVKNYRYVPAKAVEDYHQKLLNKPAPNVELHDIYNNKRSLSSHTGKVILLDFWELWCGPCQQSIEKLKDLSAKYSQRDFEIWSIVSDKDTFSKVKQVVENRLINYPVMYGTEETSSDYYLVGVPLYVIVDKMGIIRYAKAGFNSDLEEQIKKYLN